MQDWLYRQPCFLMQKKVNGKVPCKGRRHNGRYHQ